MTDDDIDASWTPAVNDLVLHTPHHPAFKAPEFPLRITRIAGAETGCPSYWCQPIGPVHIRKLRNGREVEERPNYELLCGRSTIRRSV